MTKPQRITLSKGKEQEPYVNKWLETLPSGHPARTAFGAAKIAPGKTRGSFYTSALATLKLFSGASIYSMTSESDYDPKRLCVDKTALFIILPDDRSTYYRLASIIVKQHYQKLVEQADERGGRLKRRVNFILDEFGNFAKIPDFTNMLTVGGGRGIRFNLFLQDFAQLDSKYDKDEAKTIRSNCETWVYLKSNDTETNKAVSERLGKYTTTVYSLSNSTSRYTAPSSGSSVQLTGRELLLADEVARIKRPEALVITAGNYPVVTKLPDISKWLCNDMLGLGDPTHNSAVIAARAMGRPERDPAKPSLWGIWDVYASGEANPFDRMQTVLTHDQPSAFADFNRLYDEMEEGYYSQGPSDFPDSA